MNFITDKTVSGLPVSAPVSAPVAPVLKPLLQLVSDLLQIVPGDIGKSRAIRLVLIPFAIVVPVCTVPVWFRSIRDA